MGDSPDRTHRSVPTVIELDHVFEALAHPRRRYLLYSLLEDEEWTLWELAAKVTAWEEDIPLAMATDDEVERTYVSLYHSHLPKLVEDDIVEFGEADETISPASNAEQVLTVLENAGGSRDTRQEAHARSNAHEGHT